MHRGVSIPAWTVLREPSEASGAPSGDELESRLSSEMVDEIAPTPQPPARRRPPDQSERPNAVASTSQTVQRPAFVEGSSTGGLPSSSTTVPRNPPSPSFTRRPLSDSGSDGDIRPRKKRKKRILNPEQGPAAARTRVSLDGQPGADDTRPIRLSQLPAKVIPALKSSDALREARRHRRVTMDIGIAAHNSGQPSASQPERRFARHSDATGTPSASQKSIPSLPRSNANAPLQRAQARRRSTNEGRDARPSNGQAGPSSQRPPPTSAVPPSPEVIEILDSDDDPHPPQLTKAPPAPLNIPRRTKYQTNLPPRYREENGVIILTDDDEPAATPKPPATSAPSAPEKRPEEIYQQIRAQVSSLRPVAPLPPETSLPPRSHDHQSPLPQTTAQDEVDAHAILPPVGIRDPQDVEMAEEESVLPEILDEISTKEEPSTVKQQPVDNIAAPQDDPQDHPPDPDLDTMQEDPPLSSREPPQEGHAVEETHTTAPSPLAELPVQTQLTVEPSAAAEDLAKPDSVQKTSSPSLPTRDVDDTSTADQESSEKPPPLSDTIPSDLPNQVPPPRIPAFAVVSRSETASPVSTILDPQLQELVISEGSTGIEQKGEQASSSGLQQFTSSIPPSSCTSSSTSSSSSSQSLRKAAKIRIKAPLYSGPNGFFADVYRLSQKRRQSQTPSASQSRLAASSSTTLTAPPEASSSAAAPISPDVTKVSQMDSPPASKESSAMSDQKSAASVQVQAAPQLRVVDQSNEVPIHTKETELPACQPTKPDEDGPAHNKTSPQAVEELQNTSLDEDQPLEGNSLVAPATAPSPTPSPAHPPAPTAALEYVQAEVPTDQPSADSHLPSKTHALEVPRTGENFDEVRASQVSASDMGENATRGDTPPVENPVPRTLSQIILKAVSEKAHKVVVDLTSEDDPDQDAAKANQPGLQVMQQAILSEISASATASTATTIVTPVTPTTSAASERVKTLDLSEFRKRIRGAQRRPSQLSPIKPREKALPPLPRNLGRPNGLDKPANAAPAYSTPSVQPVLDSSSALAPPPPPPAFVQTDNVAGSSRSDAPALTSTAPMPSPPLAQLQQKPMLPRLRDLMKIAQQAKAQPPRSPPTPPEAADSAQPVPVVVNSGSIEASVPSPSDVHDSSSPAGPSQFAPIVTSASVEMVDEEATPPRSPSPETVEEEECLSLIYPDSAECTPEVEMAGEPAQVQESTVRSGRQTRSQAASDASSSASGPRRSARLTSSSASSSVEPPERPASRSRRYQPYIRTHSDEVVAAQGGIARRQANSFLQAFASAGFEAISWQKDRRRIAREFAPVTQLAKDIPHDLHDRMNSLPLAARQAGNMQVLVFEAEIRANTAADEPDAPPVYIVNDVDDEPTPPLEFYYSNLMWHGEGVPKPDHENLQGCDCVGPCDPTSRTCACVKRQRKYWDGGSNGFIYDRKGKLREHEYPIFECNMNCGCSEDCPNRVIQNGRQSDVFIAICKTANKGWGVFAGHKKIPANTYIGIYAGEYLTDSEGEIRGTHYNKFGRTYLFDLDFWFLNEGDRERKVKYCIDAYHAGNFTRYLNHSCDPNCVINACYINEANMDKPLLAIFTCRDVEPFEELCFSYFGQPDDDTGIDTKPDKDDAVYVTCQCGAPNCRGTMWK